MSNLHDWLEGVDLEEYENKFSDLGVKKSKHLSDVTEVHLKNMGMKELEIKRFLKKRSSEETNSTANLCVADVVSNRVHVKMPSMSYGQTTMSVAETTLQKQYKELYYDDPVNFKQRENNKFVLNMCASAHWRFSSTRKLIDWARRERNDRISSILTFAKTEVIASESNYTKQQSLLFNAQQLDKDYEDVRCIINGVKPLNKMKRERVALYHQELGKIFETMKEAQEGVLSRFQKVEKKAGRSEESEYWLRMLRTAREVEATITEKFNKSKELYDETENQYGPSAAVSAAKRKQKLSSKRAIKRLIAQKSTTLCRYSFQFADHCGQKNIKHPKMVIACQQRKHYL